MIISQIVHIGFVLAKVAITASLWAAAFVLGWFVAENIAAWFA